MDSSTQLFGQAGLFSIARCLVSFLLLLSFTEIPLVNTNHVDPDQMPHSAASDLDLHCLPITLLGFQD